MNKSLNNALATAKKQAFLKGTLYGVNISSMIFVIALHNVVGDTLTNDQYLEIEKELQRIMDEYNESEEQNLKEAREYIEGIANRVRVMHGMPFILD
jgi:hypothetical protein